MEHFDQDEAVVMPITDELDLHTFRPGEVKDLVPGYIEACLEEGIYELRIIHGKGKGTLRRIVHSALDKIPEVSSYQLAEGGSGGWGATVVILQDKQ